MNPREVRGFQSAILRWYARNGRDLPWRRTRDPYAVLVSEFMLQQTQVATVVPYYKDWLRRFPSFAALASAKRNDVLHAWQGLGYYARARNLHATAKLVVDRHRGRFPNDIEEIRKLPGIGKYTGHAVATFAFDQPVPIVEANTARALSRLFDLGLPIDSTHGKEFLWQHATHLMPKARAGIYNSALLDLGALVCLARHPKCGVCPVKKFCRTKNPESLPVKRPRPATKRLIENHAFILNGHKLLLTRATDRWRQMWILPKLNGVSKPNAAVLKAVFPFTNHRVTLQIFRRRSHKIDNQNERWFSKPELKSIPIPSPHRRAIEQLLRAA